MKTNVVGLHGSFHRYTYDKNGKVIYLGPEKEDVPAIEPEHFHELIANMTRVVKK